MKGLFTFFRNLKFRNKLFISYIVVSIIPIIVLGTYSYNQANAFLKQQAEQGLHESIRQAVGNISYRCRQYDNVINSVIYNFRFQQIFSSDYMEYFSQYKDYIDPFFNNILYLYKDIIQISVFTDIPEIQRGEYVLPLKLLNDFQWYQSALKSKQTNWLEKNGKLICVRIFSNEYVKNADKPALLFLNIDTQNLLSGIEDIKSNTYGILIVNNNGQTVITKNKNCNKLPDIGKVNFSNKNQAYTRIRGNDYIVIKSDIQELGWIIYYYTPVKDLSIDASRIAGVTAMITVICLMALGFLIWVFSNTFVRRINNLNKKMEIVEKGNLQIDVSSQSKDEIGELTNRFGIMLKNINQLIDDVYHSKIIQKEAEMKALQAQINPHFLYNTLSVINWMAIQADAMEISHITTTVSKFYRTVLNKGNNVISVRSEIENAKAYMEIQLVMHSYKFDFNYDISEELFEYDMINLVLQPILENALEHGIDRKKGERGKLVLTGYASGDNIEFTIEDNGPGIKEDLIKNLLTQNSKGYGLKNVHDRIRTYFGEQYGIRINSEPGKGTSVVISMPKFTLADV